ncbi:MAG: TfoX/Sxy family protein, partial [Bacteroidota bacterium]
AINSIQFIDAKIKPMAFSQDYLNFILEQLEPFGEVTYKKMFGGVGFYKDGIMFGGLMGGNLHLKVNDDTRPEFEAAGMSSFLHRPNNKSKPTYYEVPVDIVEDRDELAKWANKAYNVALKAKQPKRKK